MRRCIFDLEADNLLRSVTKIYCLCYRWEDETEVKRITDLGRIKAFFQQENVIFTGHNIVTYDLAVVEKLLGVSVPYQNCIDTLTLSWHLFEDRLQHGLESWGKDVGIEKVKVANEQWQEGNIELMLERCSMDVEINFRVWEKQKALLNELYEGDETSINKLLTYLSFKLDCVKEQEAVGIKLDIERVTKGLEKLETLAEDKMEKLKAVMPKVKVIAKKSMPKKMYKADGSLSALGEKWIVFLKEQGIPETYEGSVEYISGYEEPNPRSTDQKKEWLFGLGWKPEHIKHVRDKKTNKVTKIPQINDKDNPTEVCRSIKKLFDKEPVLAELNSIGIINHKIGLLKGFLRDNIDGRLYASAAAITSTMRLKHKYVVNLPSALAPYSEDIRASLIPDEGYLWCSSDLKSIEDKTKRHYLYPYDPEYVTKLEDPSYSPHTDIACLAGLMTREEEEFYKRVDAMEDKSSLTEEEIKEFKRLKLQRHKGKTVNFSATYLIGAAALARSLGITEKEAQDLLDTYWDLNKSLLDFTKDQATKTIDNRLWVFNPVSKFWLPLRNEKDIFSAINQSTAVYVFDLWVGFIRKSGHIILFQIHDEASCKCLPEDKEKVIKLYSESMNKVNEILKLNVEIGFSIEFGPNYAECH